MNWIDIIIFIIAISAVGGYLIYLVSNSKKGSCYSCSNAKKIKKALRKCHKEFHNEKAFK